MKRYALIAIAVTALLAGCGSTKTVILRVPRPGCLTAREMSTCVKNLVAVSSSMTASGWQIKAACTRATGHYDCVLEAARGQIDDCFKQRFLRTEQGIPAAYPAALVQLSVCRNDWPAS